MKDPLMLRESEGPGRVVRITKMKTPVEPKLAVGGGGKSRTMLLKALVPQSGLSGMRAPAEHELAVCGGDDDCALVMTMSRLSRSLTTRY
eukprot:CAMPEP_0172189916 /NCGR_PEP_ID=MMETSP1050-20130122/22807_1 /TAXON_ID=233186 /ORGANISM="Cryptomonas curvata, Strain CCAP979/52" /LENGTH=89 /DNA_ID=CAMNT_0012864699 /DNA_START=297 /DNA_END=566 /DNA_ORIENTATION=+